MGLAIGVCTPRAGSGSSTWAAGLAWTLAERRQVLLIDCDMQGGTLADLLLPGQALHGRGLEGLYVPGAPIQAAQLTAMALEVPKRGTLRVVPGLHQSFGTKISLLLKSLKEAIQQVPDDVVICDLGQCLAYPDLKNPQEEAEEISKTFSRTFVVIKDDPVLMPRAIEVLAAARFPQAELIMVQQRSGKLTSMQYDALQKRVKDIPLVATWPWDEKKAIAATNGDTPLSVAGQLSKLRL